MQMLKYTYAQTCLQTHACTWRYFFYEHLWKTEPTKHTQEVRLTKLPLTHPCRQSCRLLSLKNGVG